MAEEPSAFRQIPSTRRFPWLRLLRVIGLAIDPRKLVLAALGLILLEAGWEGLARAFPRSRTLTPRVWRPLELAYPASPRLFAQSLGSAPLRTIEPARFPSGILDEPPASSANEPERPSVAWKLAEPPRFLVQPFLALFSPSNDGMGFVHALLAAAWASAVWGIVGGAIARIAVVQTAQGTRVTMGRALGFALRKALPLVCGPLVPLLGVAVLAAFCAVFGLLYRIPGSIGPIVAGALLPLPLMAGLVMAVILIGLALAWPLMHASVATEAEDAFDALSRSYSYVQQRPAHYAAYAGLAWGIGIVGLVLIEVFAWVVRELCRWGLSFSAPPRLLAGLFGTAPILVDATAATTHAFWLFGFGLLVHGWIYSYFWSAAAVIYLLLRRSVDGTPLHDVAQSEPGIVHPTASAVLSSVPEQEDIPSPQ